MCGAFERKENDFWELKTLYTHDTAIKNVTSPLKFENQDLHDLFLETLFWIYMPGEKIIQTANIWLPCTRALH